MRLFEDVDKISYPKSVLCIKPNYIAKSMHLEQTKTEQFIIIIFVCNLILIAVII